MSNKEEYISLINSIKREGFKKEEFLDFLENSDFYSAPASAMYHNAFEGGLVDHCLNVYAILRQNVKSIEQAFNMDLGYSEDTIKIVALCHDLAKVDYYEPSRVTVGFGQLCPAQGARPLASCCFPVTIGVIDCYWVIMAMGCVWVTLGLGSYASLYFIRSEERRVGKECRL